MKHILLKTMLAAGVASMMATSALAQQIGVSIARFDDNFLTVMRNGMTEHAKTLDGVQLQVEDATDDVAKQLDQINNFIASGVDAIIVKVLVHSIIDQLGSIVCVCPSQDTRSGHCPGQLVRSKS